MKPLRMNLWLALGLAVLPLCVHAEAVNLDPPEAAMGLRAVDERGCTLRFVVDNTTMPAILFAVNAYNQPTANNGALLQAIDTAVANGCPVNEIGPDGLTALNAAILYNEPLLVELLLSKGARPEDKIVRPGKNTDGMNSYEFLELLISKDQQGDRQRLQEILSAHRSKN